MSFSRQAIEDELKAKAEKLAAYVLAVRTLDAVLTSDVFKDILHVVLRLGNCVNRGKKEGLGFKLKDFVVQLSACTSKDKSTNLFRYPVSFLSLSVSLSSVSFLSVSSLVVVSSFSREVVTSLSPLRPLSSSVVSLFSPCRVR